MKLVVIGATGATGRLLIDQAIARGHEVIAYVRSPGQLNLRRGLRIIEGQLENQTSLNAALRSAHAVLCTLGTHSLMGVNLMRHNLPLITRAMRDSNVRRLILLSAYGVGETARTASPLARAVYSTLVSSVYKDKEQSEETLVQEDLDWTGIYPVILTNGPLVEAVDTLPLGEVRRVKGMPKVSRANVARAMLDAVENGKTIGQRLVVSPSGTIQ